MHLFYSTTTYSTLSCCLYAHSNDIVDCNIEGGLKLLVCVKGFFLLCASVCCACGCGIRQHVVHLWYRVSPAVVSLFYSFYFLLNDLLVK